jgi:serine/threonine-protein kinase
MKRCPTCESRYQDGVAHCPFDGAALRVLDDPLLGRVIGGRYMIEQKLGAGGMATVYRGRHQALDREVALKVLHPKLASDADHRQRFLREARSANRVHHENVVDIMDTGETEDGLVYLVMEYLRGSTLSEQLNKGPLPLTRACHIGHQVVRALARAHALGVVHRDVKPDNVFILNRGGDTDFVKLLDFGIARSLGEMALTKSNHIYGTPAYMAPEQIEGGEIGPAADLYAFGCLLYEILSGEVPFSGQMLELFTHHLYSPPPRLLARRPDLPPALDALVHELLEKSPARRPASAYRVADTIAALLGSIPPRVPTISTTAAPTSGAPTPAPPSAPPSASLHEEDRLWEMRVHELQRRATVAYAGRAMPSWLVDLFGRMHGLIAQVRTLRDGLATLSRTSVGHGKRSHETSLRIGNALDALEAHDLELIERLAQHEQRREDKRRALGVEAKALLSAADRLDAPPGQGGPVQVHGLLGLVQRWASAQRELQELESQRDRLQSEHDDLRFQVAALKGRLGADHAAAIAESEQQSTQQSPLDSELRAKIYGLRLDADRVDEHLAELAP